MKLKLGIICFLLILSACLSSSVPLNSNDNTAVVVPNSEIPAAKIDLAKPLVISNQPQDVELGRQIDQTIESSEFRNASWGVFVISLKDGRVVCAKNGQKLFNPASTLKLITAAVALDKLGPDFRWKTSVLATKEPNADGVIEGDLILYGRGAPDFDEQKLDELIGKLKQKNVKRIKGDIVGDESYFRADDLGDGWTWNEAQWYYGAEPTALTYNENQIEIKINAGNRVGDKIEARIEPATDYVSVVNESQIVANTDEKFTDSIGLKREENDNKIYFWGETKPNGGNADLRVSVPHPPLWAARNLADNLKQNGIAVEGGARARDWKTADNIEIEKQVELASVESQTLAEIIRKMNKDSVNLYAELILRTLGARFGAEIKDETLRPKKVEGTDAFGAAIVREWLKEKGIAVSEIAIHDGSGLSRLDFITPETLGRLLVFASQMKNAENFKSSLPIAGTDGTMRGRLGNFAGKILAKTGSIKYVNSLAGYAKKTDETLAFVIFCNNETLKAESNKTIDELASLMVKF